MKPKQPELTKVEILILSTLGEICNKLEDILKGARRKFEANALEFMAEDVNLLWRAPEAYNQCFVRFGYESREDLQAYVAQFCERLEVNDAWEALEDVEAYWDEFVATVARRLALDEQHEDHWLRCWLAGPSTLISASPGTPGTSDDALVSEGRLSLVLLLPVYLPGQLLANLRTRLAKIQKELHVFGVDTRVVLFGGVKKCRLWLKQHKLSADGVFIDPSDAVLKARRNLHAVFCIQSMQTIGLSSSVRAQFVCPSDTDWRRCLFPGGLCVLARPQAAQPGQPGQPAVAVLHEHCSAHLGQFPSNEELVEAAMLAWARSHAAAREDAVAFLQDGMRYYCAPRLDRLQLERHSGLYYDPHTRLYYEPRSGYFYDSDRALYLYWCPANGSYLPVPAPAPGSAPGLDSGDGAVPSISGTPLDSHLALLESLPAFASTSDAPDPRPAPPSPQQQSPSHSPRKRHRHSSPSQPHDPIDIPAADGDHQSIAPTKKLKE